MILQSRPCNCRRITPGNPWKEGECVLCWHAEHTAKFREAWGITGPPTPVAARAHVGTPEPVGAAPCGCCKECDEPLGDFTPRPDDVPAGVVVGTFGVWPSLIDVQVRAIRRTCGNVPIYFADDCSPARDEMRRRAMSYGRVFFNSNPERIGHTGGDLSAFRRGIEFGANLNLKVIAKLSQRFVFTAARWLQDGAAELLASGLPLAARECSGHSSFDLRTEAVLLDVAAWNKPRVLDALGPRKFWTDAINGINAERIFKRVMQDHVAEHYWPWTAIPNGRDVERPGYVWHVSNQLGCYQGLAKKLGVELDANFSTDGWEAALANGSYMHG